MSVTTRGSDVTELRLADPRDTLKMIRETLCFAQSAIGHMSEPRPLGYQLHIELLGRMVNEIDRQRPLGSNGKHGNRHTPTCGCERD